MFVHFFLPFYVCTTLTDMTCSFWLVVENRAGIFISRGEGGRSWYWLWDIVLFFLCSRYAGWCPTPTANKLVSYSEENKFHCPTANFTRVVSCRKKILYKFVIELWSEHGMLTSGW